MPNTVFLIEIVGFFSRTIGFADSLYAAIGMFHGNNCLKQGIGRKECRKGMFHEKHMFRRERFRFAQRHCSNAKNAA